ncbi:helix-turn-helix transcriptional regulator [Streptomyces sp. NPDC056149]|uniref:helix-turn-helix domain-containing protein n=1 Tax=Streptomyces sp. NPDC056149 TaxID=3345728 RepID=UPI0035D912F1
MNQNELNPDRSPQAAYGARLRRLRKGRGWRQKDLAQRMDYSAVHISGVENGSKFPTLRFSKAVDVAFGLTGTAGAFEHEYREIKHGSLLEGFSEYVTHEARAVELRLFEVGVIPGPLQTREYAAAIEAGYVQRGAATADQADERVELLMQRQSALERPQPPLVFAVLDESCIRRPIGGPAVMDAQLARLIEFASQPNTSLQVAPFNMGERRPLNRLVHLLTLADRSVVGYVESQTQGYLDRESSSVLPLVRAYHQLQTEAPSQAETVAMIEQVRKGKL